VKGYIASPVGAKEFNALHGTHLIADQYVFNVAAFA
jgi:hypothetical protein